MRLTFSRTGDMMYFWRLFQVNQKGLFLIQTLNTKLYTQVKINKKIRNLELQKSEYILTLIVIYGPNKDDPMFYENLKDKLKNNENKLLTISGDWNLVLNHSMDTVGYVRENNIKAKKKVLELIEIFELIDPWRCSYPAARKYS